MEWTIFVEWSGVEICTTPIGRSTTEFSLLMSGNFERVKKDIVREMNLDQATEGAVLRQLQEEGQFNKLIAAEKKKSTMNIKSPHF